MSVLKSLLVAVSIAAANANPISPSIVARATPSDFPLGEPCGNEWKYLNFDPDNTAHKEHLQKLHDVICSGELRAVSARGFYAADQTATSIIEVYDVFFETGDGTPAKVSEVLKKIAGQGSDEGMIGEAVGSMIVDNTDFGGDTNCDDPSTQAYTKVDEAGDQLEKIHFCDTGYDRPTSALDLDCSTLDSYPSDKMDTFARLALHETLHYKTIGEDSQLGAQIIDQKNEDGEYTYGVIRAHGLNDPDQDDQPAKAELNADNYAYMSLAGWVGFTCSPEEDKEDYWDSYFPDDPPEYT